jgi:DNA polymerase
MTDIAPSDKKMTPEEALALLSFQLDAGVSDFFCADVQNRYQFPENAPSISAVQNEQSARRPAAPRSILREGPPPAFQSSGTTTIALSEIEAIEMAREVAARAQTLDALQAAIAEFEGCTLRKTAKNTVFADGNPEARIMLIGEAPGRDEDLEGIPFAGHAGLLLGRMLAAIGLTRDDVYLANMLPWRPPGGRMPTPGEQAICQPFISRQIELCAPALLVFTGSIAAKGLLGVSTSLPRLRGQWKTYSAGPDSPSIPALTMFAPDYLLKHSAQKRLAWADLLSLKAKIGELPPHH